MTAEPKFDEIIHAPNRLRICAALAAVTEAEFSALREALGVADPVLSKHLRTLHDAGYVTLTKPTGRGGRVRTWVSLTATGRRALEAHIAELHRLTGHLSIEPEVGRGGAGVPSRLASVSRNVVEAADPRHTSGPLSG